MKTVSRKKAEAAGLKRYFTSKKCLRGHIAERFISGRACVKCSTERHHTWRKTNPEKVRERHRTWRKANLEKARESVRTYQKANPEKHATRSQLRRAHKFNAIPIWACKESIDKIYAKARQLTVETNIKHEVDHIVPLKSPFVCGLHVHYNLQAIPTVENRKKGNRFNT